MPVVHGIVHQSGGYIWVYSEVGRGTTFKVFLPRVHGALDSSAERARAPAPRVVNETVLVVEDQPQVLQLTRRILTAAGYEVLIASSGTDAVALVDAGDAQVDLVLTDVVMPRMTGRELVLELRKRRPGLKALYMSGYTQDAIAHQGVLEPGFSYVSKPFSANDLLRRVRDVLDQEDPVV